jgi:hypothetical protein
MYSQNQIGEEENANDRRHYEDADFSVASVPLPEESLFVLEGDSDRLAAVEDPSPLLAVSFFDWGPGVPSRSPRADESGDSCCK